MTDNIKDDSRIQLTETEFGELSHAMQKAQVARNEAVRAEAEMGTVVRLLSDRAGINLAETPYQLLAETHELVKQEESK